MLSSFWCLRDIVHDKITDFFFFDYLCQFASPCDRSELSCCCVFIYLTAKNSQLTLGLLHSLMINVQDVGTGRRKVIEMREKTLYVSAV